MRLLTIAILAFVFTSCQERLAEGNYRIHGKVTGLEKGELYLMSLNGADTVKVEKGRFLIENALKEPVSEIYLSKTTEARSVENLVRLYIEPSIMNLKVDYNDLQKSRLSGSETQNEAYSLNQIREDIRKKYQKELDDFDTLSQEFRKARAAGASEAEIAALKEKDYIARAKLEPYFAESRKATLAFIKNNPQSYVSLSNLRFLLRDMQYEEAKDIFDHFDHTYKTMALGKNLAVEIENMKKGIPGAMAGNFNTTDINGKPLKLADFKGKYLLIDFWASWCVPCRKGNPHLIDIYHKYHDKGLELLGVSDDDRNPTAWRNAVKKDKIGIWHHVLRGATFDRKTGKNKFPEKDISDGYNISTLPTKILVGPDGIILGRFGSGGGTDEDMDKMLAEIFDNE